MTVKFREETCPLFDFLTCIVYWSFSEWPTASLRNFVSISIRPNARHCRSKCSKPRAAVEWFYWKVWNILTSVLWSIRVQTMEINSSIFYNIIESFWTSITLNILGKSHARENLREQGNISSFPFSVLHQSACQNHSSVTVTAKSSSEPSWFILSFFYREGRVHSMFMNSIEPFEICWYNFCRMALIYFFTNFSEHMDFDA